MISKDLLTVVLGVFLVIVISLAFLVSSRQRTRIPSLETPSPDYPPPPSSKSYSLSADGSTLFVSAQISNIAANEDKTFLEIKFNNSVYNLLALEENDPFGLLLTNGLRQNNTPSKVVEPILVTKTADLNYLKGKRVTLTFLLDTSTVNLPASTNEQKQRIKTYTACALRFARQIKQGRTGQPDCTLKVAAIII